MHRLSGVTLRALLAVLVVAASVVSFVPAAQAQDDRTLLEYRVDLETSEVVVTTTVPRGRLPSPVEISVPSTTTTVVAESGGTPLGLEVSGEDDFWRYYLLDLSGAGDTFEVTHRIPSDEPRTYGYHRINSAHIEFPLLPDPAFGRTDVTVVLPAGFRADLGPQYNLMDPGITPDGSQIWTATNVFGESFQVFFVARNESGLRREQVDVGGRKVEIAAWAEDEEWQDFARRYVGEGVPILADLIGSRLPEDELVVIESTAPYEGGAAGWYLYFDAQIEVGDFLHEDTMMHELAHAWFNGISTADTWMIEGFAEVFAHRALAVMNGEVIRPEPPDRGRIGTTELARWEQGYVDEAYVLDYYNTSWYVMDELYEEIGADRFADVVQVLLDGDPSYAVEGSTATRPINDWRRLLDVLEETGGSQIAAELFETHVAPANNSQLLETRAEARSRYSELVAMSAPFAAPLAVRARMAEWKFGEAELLMDEAAALVARLQAVEDRASALDLTVPEGLWAGYEDAAFSFGGLERELDDAEDALTVIETADDEVAADDIAQARRRFERGLFSAVIDTDGSLATKVAEEDQLPMLTIAIAAVAIGLFAVGMLVAITGGRRRMGA